MKRILGNVQPRMVIAPVATGSADVAGAWVNMGDYDSALFLIGCDDDAGTSDVAVHVRQANTNAGGGVKDVAVRRFYRAEAAGLSVATPFAAVAPATHESLGSAALLEGDDHNVLAVEVTADELDINNGFRWVTVGFSAGAAGKLLCAFVLLSGARYAVELDDAPDVS